MNRLKWIFLVCLLMIVEIGIIGYQYSQDQKTDIPTDYVAIFKGENSDTVHTTYLYKTKKGKYKYINTVSTTNSYDSVGWQEEIIKKGKVKKKKDIFKIAEKNDANSYVKYIEEDKIYRVEEFKLIWK